MMYYSILETLKGAVDYINSKDLAGIKQLVDLLKDIFSYCLRKRTAIVYFID